MAGKKIKITCEGTDYVDYKTLKPLQGNLKILSDENLCKLKKSIIKYGFTAPAFIWKSGKTLYSIYCHQRVKALDSLFADGYEIPDIPIVYIKAKDKKEAKEKLLHITSSYGEFTQDGLTDFVYGMDFDIEMSTDFLDGLRLANEEMTLMMPDFEPATEEEQGKLDELDPKWITCPHCGEKFDEREA